MNATRKIAAILVADVVGYSRLAETDEDRTLARLRALRSDLVDPTVAIHNGRVVKRTGDGAIVEFRSVLDAVRCAADIQGGMIERNTGLSSDRRIEFRIGIHLGDVVEESDGDLMGDGVNVAARLESVCDAGGICLSEDAYRQVRDKIRERFVDLGELSLKNISRPLRAYCILGGLPETRRATEVSAEPTSLSAKPSIAVLPFANMTGDAEQQYFCDGITEDIITELSRFRQIQVASRHSSSRFRGPEIDLVTAGRALGVHYLVEGSVRRMRGRTRITAQLIDATTGNHIWADRYDCGQEEIFDIQDQVVRTIVVTLAGRMNAARTEFAKRKPIASLAAYEHFLRGDALPIGTPESELQARRHFESAIELDPSYARAYAMLCFSLEREWLRDMSGSNSLLDQAFEMAHKAISLDEDDFLCQLAMLWVNVDRHSYELAEQHLAKALALNPNQPSIQTDRGIFYVCMGKPEKGIEVLLEVRQLDPFFAPSWYWGELGAAYFMARRDEDAIASMRRASVLTYGKEALLAACYAKTQRPDLAAQSVSRLLGRIPDFSVIRFLEKQAFVRAEDLEYLAEALRGAGLPE